MEITTYNYLLLLAFIKLAAFGSVAFIILKISKNHCFDDSMTYYKTYFILAFFLTFLNMGTELLGLEKQLNIVLFVYLAVSSVLLLAVNEKFRNNVSLYTVAVVLLTYLVSSIYFQFTFMQNLIIHAVGSLVIYIMLFSSAIVKAKQLNNIGFSIMAFAFMIIILFSFVEGFYLLMGDSKFAYTLAVSSANSAFIVVIIGFLTKIMMSEYNVINTIALTDPLTSMNNRRGLYYLLESLIPSSNRDSKCYSVIAMDIDFFKKVNDTYGHDGGDIVLKEFSNMIKTTQRNTDISARLGGEEFVIVLPDTDKNMAIVVAEKLRLSTEEMNININGTTIKITSSFGVDTSCNDFDIDELFKNADKALYEAKFSGRNRVIHFLDI